MKNDEGARRPSDRASEVDAALRAALTPDWAIVDRMVRTALRPDRPRYWPRIVAAAATVLALIALPILRSGTRSARPSVANSAVDLELEVPAPARLRISNETGPLTVTTAAGSKVIFITPALLEQTE